MAKIPAFQFYPGDWMKDANLRRCSHLAKGVWIDMLCLMFEADERGVLATAGVAWSDDEVARALGGDLTTTMGAIQELSAKGVIKRRSNGAMYSKRIVTDENKRKLCAEAGKRGGNPNLVKTLKGLSKGESKGESKGQPTPSSSSSSSDNINTPLKPPKGGGGGDDPQKPPEPEFPAGLDTPAFSDAWGEWLAYRREKRLSVLKNRSVTSQLSELCDWGESVAIESIRQSIRQGWQGLFAPKCISPKKAGKGEFDGAW